MVESGFNWFEILVIGGFFVLAALISLLWFRRYRKEKQEVKVAKECLESGQYIAALRHLSNADENWGFNNAHATPKNMVRDLDRLAAIIEMIGDVTDRLGTPVYTNEILTTVKDLRNVFSIKKHYKFGTFDLKKEFETQAGHLLNEIEQRRSKFQQSYLHLLH